jgi:hypothetical protein
MPRKRGPIDIRQQTHAVAHRNWYVGFDNYAGHRRLLISVRGLGPGVTPDLSLLAINSIALIFLSCDDAVEAVDGSGWCGRD